MKARPPANDSNDTVAVRPTPVARKRSTDYKNWMRKLALAGVALLPFIVPAEARAYLDPGTGSAIIQMAIAAVVGGLFVLKTYWRKVVSIFTGRTSEEIEGDGATTNEESD